jgi:hypothetical protein
MGSNNGVKQGSNNNNSLASFSFLRGVNADTSAFGGPEIQPFRDPANSEGGLGPQPQRNLHFGWRFSGAASNQPKSIPDAGVLLR